MNNDVIDSDSWTKRNWKWLLPVTISILFLTFYTIIPVLNNEAPEIIKAYSDTTIFEKAIEIANTNSKVKTTIGTIEAIDKLAILEGNIVYSNNYNSIASTIRVKSNRNHAKMDFIANKKGNEWIFQKLTVRCKNPEKAISIIE
nr:cytochrome c oxidase assembly factor Coa1 family protein [uncultured Flavobacterium sp.]